MNDIIDISQEILADKRDVSTVSIKISETYTLQFVYPIPIEYADSLISAESDFKNNVALMSVLASEAGEEHLKTYHAAMTDKDLGLNVRSVPRIWAALVKAYELKEKQSLGFTLESAKK